MRGGAIPLLAWALILAVLFAGNWVWAGDAVQVGAFGLAVALVSVFAAALAGANRSALRRGPPPLPAADELERRPEISYGAVGVAIAVGAAVFGLAFGHFLIYFGAGLLVLSLGRIALELRAAREMSRRYRPLARPPGRTRAGAPGERASAHDRHRRGRS